MIKKRIVICGGHLSPAVAVIEELLARHDCEIFYIGRKYAFERDKTISLEYKTIHDFNIPFYSLTTGRLQRSFSATTFFSFLKIPIGFIQSILILRKKSPDIVVSFGSYMALPVSLCAVILGIPVITHEQTRIMGLTNRIIARLARCVCLAWSDTRGVPKGINTYTTGLPLRKTLFDSSKSNNFEFGDRKLPLIYITGGSSGSMSINHVVQDILPQLLTDFRVIHQTGDAYQSKDYEHFRLFRQSLGKQKKHNYKVVTHVPMSKMGVVLRNTNLAVGRSGANTVAELDIMNIPCILIPLPWSGQGEQQQNAKYLVDKGKAIIISQSDLTPRSLYETILFMLQKYPHRTMNNVVHATKYSATSKFVKLLLGTIENE